MQNRISCRRSISIIVLTVLFSVCLCSVAFAETAISPQLDSNVLQYRNGEGPVKSLNISDCTDPVMKDGVQVGRIFCVCQGVAFRVAQLMSDKWSDGVFHVDDVQVVTGWKTDGPEDLFVHKLGMIPDEKKGFSYDKSAPEVKDQTLEDAWYQVIILSTGENYTFHATEKIYGTSDSAGYTMLDYRREVEGGDPTHKAEMKTMRAMASKRLAAQPFAAGSFRIR